VIFCQKQEDGLKFVYYRPAVLLCWANSFGS